jgi:sugar phosphate isomerase/epimerase
VSARQTLEAVARIGYQALEIGRGEIATLGPHLKELKLTAPSGHFEAPLVTGNWDGWKAVRNALPAGYDWSRALADAKGAGLKLAVVAYVQRAERSVPDFYPRFADQMNRAGEQAAQAGIRLCYHHHSFEFEPKDGKKPFDLLVDRFDPRFVHWELDLFWLAIAGEDPAARLRQLKGRVAAVHLKDIAAGAKTEFWEGAVPPGAFKEVGNGTLDWTALLKACQDAGVEHYIVEQDQCPGNPLDSITQSYRFLWGAAA